MNEKDFKELERLFWIYYNYSDKENARGLKDFLKYCVKSINLNRYPKK